MEARPPLFTPPPTAVLAVFLGVAGLAGYVYFNAVPSGAFADFTAHARFAREAWEGTRPMPPHALYHWVLIGASAPFGGIGDSHAAALAGALVATVCTVTRAVLFDSMAVRAARRAGWNFSAAQRAAFTAVLAVAAAAPAWWSFPAVYLGQFHANVWHNPTHVLSATLAVAALNCVILVESPSAGRLAAGAALLAASALAKPNAFLALAPALGLAAALGHWSWRRAAMFAGPALLVSAAVVFRFTDEKNMDGGIAVAPFMVWNRFTRADPSMPAHKLAALCVSAGFPLAVWVLLPRTRALDGLKAGAVAALVASVSTFALLAEHGRRVFDGNFGWGAHFAISLVFAVALLQFIQQAGRPDRRIGVLAAAALLAAHLAGGILLIAGSVAGLDWRA